VAVKRKSGARAPKRASNERGGAPTAFELLWGADRQGARGPRRSLSVEVIARAGIAIADADGLESLSMQRVARDLGYTTMSIYTYAPSKQLLIEVMCDVAAGPPPTPRPGAAWRDHVEHWAAAAWEVFLRHPWMLRTDVPGPPVGPNQLAWLDQGIAALRRAGLPPADALSTAVYVLGAVRGLARLAIDAAHRAGDDDRLAAVLTHFPALAEAASASGAASPWGDGGHRSIMTFGLQLLLDAVEQRARAGASPAGSGRGRKAR
jgi:AcrR family transcriptional regulator